MANRKRSYALVAIVLLPLFLTSGWARAATITVDTTAAGEVAGACSLLDAVISADTHATPSGSTCAAGTGNDTIEFSVTGTIFTLELLITDPTLVIRGPVTGGITLDAERVTNIIDAINVDKLSLLNLTFTNGKKNFLGGGILAENVGELSIDNCTFSNNSTEVEGGALLIMGGTLATVTNSTFANNSGGDGAAIKSGSTALALINDTFSGSAQTAAVVSGSAVSAKGTILQNGTFGPNCNAPFSLDQGYNISDDNSCGFGSPSLNNTDAKLDPTGLQNNGGPTQTIALEPGSPAIDLIPIAACTDAQGNPLTTDQRLFGRPDFANHSACDSGAYEFDAKPPFVVPHRLLRIHHPIPPNLREFNLDLTFGENAVGTCQADQDALNSGIVLELFSGTCGQHPSTGLDLALSPFVVRTAGNKSYGTFFETLPSGGTVSARIATLPRPAPADSCGEWKLDVDAAGLDIASLGLDGAGPIALQLSSSDGAFAQCFDINDVNGGGQAR
jgi:hypothetical protein